MTLVCVRAEMAVADESHRERFIRVVSGDAGALANAGTAVSPGADFARDGLTGGRNIAINHQTSLQSGT